MSLSTKLEKLRKKPQYVKERILLVIIAIAVPVLLTVWFATFDSGFRNSGGSFTSDFAKGIFNSFNDPIYKQTFAQPPLLGSPTSSSAAASTVPAQSTPAPAATPSVLSGQTK